MRILIVSGGSGGHIFPAVSVAGELREKGHEIIFVASRRRLDKKILANNPYIKMYLSANPMPYVLGWKTPVFLCKLVLDFFQALYILMRFKPRGIIGFGGYTSGIIVFLGALFGARTVIHEQNLVPGRTNRILDRLVGTIAVSFPETKKHFKNKDVVFTGNPLREESLENRREEAYDKFNFNRNKFTLLVMGGSQGASFLNKLASKALSAFSREEKEKIQIIHIAGTRDFNAFKDFYAACGVTGNVFEFVDNINEVYSMCDLAISRSGAAAIFELAAFAKPMILVPYPGEKNNQRFNAMFLADRNAAIYRDEKDLDEKKLENLIRELMNNPEKRAELSRNAKRLSVTDGAKTLAALIA